MTEPMKSWIAYLQLVDPQEKTFLAAMHGFYRVHGQWPQFWWPGMPKRPGDRKKLIADVPAEQRRGDQGNEWDKI